MSTVALPNGMFRLILEQSVDGVDDTLHKGTFETSVKLDMTAVKLLSELEDAFEAFIAANNERKTCLFCEANIADGDHGDENGECALVDTLANLAREAKR